MSNLLVSDALSALSLTATFKSMVTKDKVFWQNFGKKNSHMYRKELFTSMSASNLNNEEKMVVIFLFCVIKNQPRVMRELDNMNEELKAAAWYAKVREFVATKITQYVTTANTSKKFPAVNIPTAMPGFDILVYCLITEKSDRNLEEMFKRPTASQLNLSVAMQARAKEGYAYYWDNVVTGSNNSVQTEEPKMRENYYKNSESDKYNLVEIDSKNVLKEKKPNNVEVGFTEAELQAYIDSI